MMTNDDLPDFLELHTFAVAARWMHLTRAATELHVTQGAVSQRIKQLEQRLGTALFVRNGRELQLTAAGHTIRQKAEALLAQRTVLFSATQAAPARTRAIPVIVNTTPSVAGGWLLPRLERFLMDCPDISLQMVSSLNFTRFRGSHAELAIRYGAGGWPQVQAVPLMKDWLYPVASPHLDRGGWPAGSDWSTCRLLEDVEEPWELWLHPDTPRASTILRVNDALVLLEACMAGLGVALMRHRVACAAVQSGRLMRLPGAARPARFSHWLVTPQADSLSVRAREARGRVAEWLRGEAERPDPQADAILADALRPAAAAPLQRPT
jgi:LysR family glycine cleavage system transcriptional activator